VPDALGSISEVPTRIKTTLRTAADAISSVAEAAVRQVGRVRVVGDALGSLGESVARGATLFARGVGDALASLVETIASLKTTEGWRALFLRQSASRDAEGDTIEQEAGPRTNADATMNQKRR
jgi:hypothetical protein